MWSALENMALRESLPPPLQPGESINGILVAGQFPVVGHNLFHLGSRRSRPYLLKQFYSLDTDAFLRRQNESRFITVPQTPNVNWPTEEWRGGVVIPRTTGITLKRWIDERTPPIRHRLEATANLALHLATLHASGVAHRDLSLDTILIGGKNTVLTDFGSAVTNVWDDLWTDTLYKPRANAWACPPMPWETEPPFAIDIHAFGAIMQILTTGIQPYTRRHCLAYHCLPFRLRPIRPPRNEALPAVVYELIEACLASRPEDRPTMQDVADKLKIYSSGFSPEALHPIESSPRYEAANRIMVFINDDHQSVSLFDVALDMAVQHPSMFLFVSIIPNNLPSGHAQRFKGNLFRKLNHGLMRCRAANVSWSLRILENVDPEQAAVALISQYQPHTVLVGTPNSRVKWRTSFPKALKSRDIPVTIIN